MEKKNFFRWVILKIFGNIITSIVKDEVKKEIDLRLTPQKKEKLFDVSLVDFPKKNLKIRISKAGSMDHKSFTLSRPLKNLGDCGDRLIANYPDKFVGLTSEQGRKFGMMLLETDMLDLVHITPFEVSVKKSAALNWKEVQLKVTDIIASFFEDVEEPEPAT